MFKKILAIALLVPATSTAFAAETTSPKGKFHAGVKFGSMLSSYDLLDDSTGLGFQGGYSLSQNWSIEFEYLSSTLDYTTDSSALPELQQLNSIGVNFDGEADFNSMTVFATYRSSGKFYFMGKVGFGRANIESDITATGFGLELNSAVDSSDTGLGLGLGGGFRINDRLSLEAEYSVVEADIHFFGATGLFTF